MKFEYDTQNQCEILENCKLTVNNNNSNNNSHTTLTLYNSNIHLINQIYNQLLSFHRWKMVADECATCI